MKQVFADTHYFLALFNPLDQAHTRALEHSARRDLFFVSTVPVMVELANGLSRSRMRTSFAQFFTSFEHDADNRLVTFSDELLRLGIERYHERADKEWSLVDCISFVVMEREEIHEALTADHHFEQAGFVALLK